jgi:hypothetical protein
MRTIFFCSLIFALLITTNREPQAAPWCSMHSSGSSNCGFYSYEQCREHLLGVGGDCERNPHEYAGDREPLYRSEVDAAPRYNEARRYRRSPVRPAAGHWQTTRQSNGWLIQRHDRSGAWRAIPSEPGRRVAYHWNGGNWVPASYRAGRS